MSNVHALVFDGGSIHLVCHIPIPTVNGGVNQAGVAWETAFVRSGGVKPTVMVVGDGTGGTISATERDAILAGQVIEREVHFAFPSNWESLNAAQKNQLVDDKYAQLKNDVQGEVQAALRYFGLAR